MVDGFIYRRVVCCFENSLKSFGLKEFSVQRKTVKKEERDLYSLIFERPLFYFHKTWWMILKKSEICLLKKTVLKFWKKFSVKKNCTKKDERDLYSLIFERPHI